MTLINLAQMLRTARKGRFGVGAFNGVDSHFLKAIFKAAADTRSPVIINVAEVHLRYLDFEDIAALVRHRANNSGLPVTLNLDHGVTFPTVERAVRAGFTSVMFDGSSLSHEENVLQTAEVVRLCHANGVSVEGELGAVGGDEGGALDGHADESHFTDPAQAADYVSRTGVDALAVAIGNSHGRYKGTPKLDFERLSVLAGTVGTPLVLHGGSGLSDDDFRRAISLGIAKVNFYTGMSQVALDSLRRDVDDQSLAAKYDHYLMSMTRAAEAVEKTVVERMEVFGSAGKADLYHD